MSKVSVSSLAILSVLLLSCPGRNAGAQAVARVNGRAITAAEFAAVLPWAPDSALGEKATRYRALEELVVRELFVQEAERRGLEDSIAYFLELEQKAAVIQELYNEVVKNAKRLPEMELRAAYRLLQNEAHLKLISVDSESLARAISAALDAGVSFESLAARHSTDRSAAMGGDLGFMPELAVEEPLRSAALALTPGRWTKPVRFGRGYQLVKLIERRPADPAPPPFGELKQELAMRLEQQKRRLLADEYLANLRGRLVFNPAGLDIMCKPADSITPAEQEEWVAIRDKTKYVKVGRLMHIARKFPASIDTALRKYAVKREIEEDIMYEDGLTRGLDRRPSVAEPLTRRRTELLYQMLFQHEVADSAEVSDEEVRQYYEARKEDYPGMEFSDAAIMIRPRLATEKGALRLAAYREGLMAGADVTVDSAAAAKVKFRKETEKKRGAN